MTELKSKLTTITEQTKVLQSKMNFIEKFFKDSLAAKKTKWDWRIERSY